MQTIQEAIHAKIVQLAKDLGHDARSLKDDAVIPDTGLLDSAALMELVVWLETTYSLEIDQDDITLENFGTIRSMIAFLRRQQGRFA